ncbi:hypothetical protein [Ottowia testudinis]|uniref:PsiF repeat-containing protein n=1 Tax=Ottowia testudinis TaxID=2816950 RepID=A0A975H4W0_9BURK|nr:hypothetical protein [Ottowia testudinis]QTD46785.1 hypothetical protein J1M35_07915 [Ottowia testudinis]
MTSVFTRSLALSTCVLCLALTAAPADAKARSKRAKEAGPKVTYADGQNAAQRQRSEEARLKRECKGRPNAGACLGYAS